MAGSLALSGLASGVDTSSIIQQLMAVESQGRTRLTNKQSQVSAGESAIKDVQSKLTALQSAASALTSSSLWTNTQTADSSDSSRVGATLLSATAGAGGTTLNVTALASSAQHAYSYDSTSGATIKLMRGSTQVGSDVTIDAGTSIADAAAKINSSNLDVSATVVTDDGVQNLVLAAKSTGAVSDFSVTGLSASTNARWERTGGDATFTVGSDTTVRTSSTNVVDNAIPGVRLTLKATTASPVTVTVGSPTPSTDGVNAQIQAYVKAYNALIDTVNAKLTEKTSKTDVTQGTLFGDTGLSSLVSNLRLLTSRDDPTNTVDSLADLGITTGAPSSTPTDDSKLGKLTIDSTKLSDLLTSSPDKVKSLLAGVSKTIGAYVTGQSKVLDGRVTSAESEQRSLTDQLSEMDRQLDLKQKRLEAQFTAMETALSQSQSMQSQLTSQIASLG